MSSAKTLSITEFCEGKARLPFTYLHPILSRCWRPSSPTDGRAKATVSQRYRENLQAARIERIRTSAESSILFDVLNAGTIVCSFTCWLGEVAVGCAGIARTLSGGDARPRKAKHAEHNSRRREEITTTEIQSNRIGPI